jgi:hypothetical protein
VKRSACSTPPGRARQPLQAVTDSLGLLDTSRRGPELDAGRHGLAGAAGHPVAGQGWAQAITEALGLLDAAGQSSAAAQAVTEALGLLDAPGTAQGWAQAPTDALGLTDAHRCGAGLEPGAGRQCRAERCRGSGLGDGQALTDSVGLADSTQAGATGNITATLTDGIGITDSTATLAASPDQFDAVGLLDSAATVQALTPYRCLGLLDSATAVQALLKHPPMHWGSPTPARVQAASRAAADTVGLTDAVQSTVGRCGVGDPHRRHRNHRLVGRDSRPDPQPQ